MSSNLLLFARAIFLSLAVLAGAGTVCAQQSTSDSLKQLLAQPMPDTSRILLLENLGRSLMYSKPLVAMEYIKKGLALAEQKKYPKGIIRNQNRLGSVYRIIGSYDKSLEAHLGALKRAEDNSDLDGMARTLNNIGILYSEQKDSKKAIDYFSRAKSLAEKIEDPVLIEITLTNIGTDYALLDQLDSALVYTLRAYEMSIRQKGSNTGTLLINLGNIYYRKSVYPLSLEYYRRSLPLSKAEDDLRNLSLTYYEMAQVFNKTNVRDSCLYYAEKSLAISREIDNPKNIYDASLLLSQLYEEEDKSKAYTYFKLAIESKDKMFNQQKIKEVQNLGFSEQIRQQEIADLKAAEAEERKHNLQLMAIAIFIIMFFLLVLLLSKRKTNPRVVESLGLVALLLFFEFINLLFHPLIEKITHHTPVFMLLLLVLLASVLAPLHHYLTDWVKKLARKIKAQPALLEAHKINEE